MRQPTNRPPRIPRAVARYNLAVALLLLRAKESRLTPLIITWRW